MKKKVTAVILAAGKGKRAKTSMPKVLLELCGRAIILHILSALSSLKVVDDIIVVLGHKRELVQNAIKKVFPKVKFVYQKELNGTARAVSSASSLLKNKSNVLVLCGDTPLIKASTLRKFINSFFKERAKCSVMTAVFKEKNDYGRITRDSRGNVVGITEKVELKADLDREEVNSGIYCFEKSFLLKGLTKIKVNKKKKEFFLTDIINIAYKGGFGAKGFCLEDNLEILGVNTQKNLSKVRKLLNERLIEVASLRGVTFIDPDTTFLSFDTKIGKDTVIYPFTFIEKNVIIGSYCELGPFLRVRKGSAIGSDVKIGNFIEINRSTIGSGSRAKHFGYLGDAIVKDKVNIGAGTVIANYDGKNKHKTIIETGAFIGSDTVIVAPRKIGKGARTGAGSVVTRDVKNNDVVVGVPARVFIKEKKLKTKRKK